MSAIDAIRIWRTTTTPQIFGNLLSDEGVCALGALIAAYAEMAGHRWPASLHVEKATFDSCQDFFGMHNQMDGWQLASCPIGSCLGEEETGEFMIYHMNDDHQLSFSEIADIAEQHPELLFTDDEARSVREAVAAEQRRKDAKLQAKERQSVTV